MGELFGTDGIRGQANCHPITPEIALQVGKAIGAVMTEPRMRHRRVVIGKDTRLSGYMLETALTSGLVSMGMSVYLVGPVPTPAVAHLTKSMDAAVGVMLTASHNPFQDNGIKIFDRDGYKLSDSVEAEIESLVFNPDSRTAGARGREIGKAQRIEDARGRYIEFAKSTIRNQSLDGLRVVLDCANGAAYQIGPWVFDELGADVVKTAVSPDGYNINESCGAIHPQSVAKLVREYRADIGVALDGDADRVIFADQNGDIIDGDRILGICALDLMARGRLNKDTLVVTTMSNLGLHDAMQRRGISVEVTEVGDKNVIDRMRQGGYSVGGEKSGHVILSDYGTTGDGIITALRILMLMKQGGKRLSELADFMTEYPQRQESLYVREKRPLADVEPVASAIRDCEAALGGDGRVIVRYSGTEMKIRILVEAKDKRVVSDWTKKLVAVVEKELGR